MRSYFKHVIIVLLLLSALFWSFCGIFIIAPIGILPEGRTIIFYRIGSGLPFLSSVESLQREAGRSQSLLGKAIIFVEISEPIIEREILTTRYSEWLYKMTLNGEYEIQKEGFNKTKRLENESAITFIKVSELSTTSVTSDRVKIIGKIENTSTRNINWISYNLILMKNGEVVDVHSGFYPCNLNGNYGLPGLGSCFFDSRSFVRNTFDSYRLEIASAEF